jgi:hypothetical protein
MQPHTKKFTRPAPEFTFAGFQFPKWAWTLPRGSKAKRLASYKNPVCGPYSISPAPNDCKGTSFYLDSDFMPGLRWQWCDDVAGSIRHTGWFTTEYGDGDKIRGLVMRLPHGRGFLAGWSMGESMISYVESSAYESENDAAHAADSLAEDAAEKEREYQEKEEQQTREAEEQESMELCALA